jgi:4-hydroxy-2-oxoheptanedioate aldolase
MQLVEYARYDRMPKDSRQGLKAVIRAGKPLIGSYVTFPSPEIVELFANAGMDYVIIDLQHASADWQTLTHMLRAADAGGVSPIVRLYTHDPSLILKVLELGAEAISLPGVKSAADIRAAVDAMYYPPLGHRGACGHTRVGGYNSRRADFPEHVRRQNERVCIWAIVEDPDSIGRVGEIAAVRPGADVVGVGRGDLSTAMGLHGQVNHPDVIAANETVIKEVQTKSGGQCASATMIQRPEDIVPWFERGCRLFTYAADAILLMEAARGAVEKFRSSLPGNARG